MEDKDGIVLPFLFTDDKDIAIYLASTRDSSFTTIVMDERDGQPVYRRDAVGSGVSLD